MMKSRTPLTSDNMRLGLILATILIAVALSGCVLKTEKDLGAAIAKVEMAQAEQVRMQMLAWRTVEATLEQAWRQLPLEEAVIEVAGDYLCTHLAPLDAAVDGLPFEVWRCEYTGQRCDPRYDDVCIVLGGDGIRWEFRFQDQRIGTMSLQ